MNNISQKCVKSMMSGLVALTLIGSTAAAQAALVHPKADRAPAAADHASDQADMRRFNLQWDVLKTVFGYVSGSANFKVAQAVAVGLGAGTWMYGDTNTDTGESHDGFGHIWDLTARMSYAFNGHVMQSGWLLSPFIGYAHASTKDLNGQAEDDHGLTIGVPFYYQWMWDSGFNMQLGIGPAYSDIRTGSASFKGAGLTGGFTLGYAF